MKLRNVGLMVLGALSILLLSSGSVAQEPAKENESSKKELLNQAADRAVELILANPHFATEIKPNTELAASKGFKYTTPAKPTAVPGFTNAYVIAFRFKTPDIRNMRMVWMMRPQLKGLAIWGLRAFDTEDENCPAFTHWLGGSKYIVQEIAPKSYSPPSKEVRYFKPNKEYFIYMLLIGEQAKNQQTVSASINFFDEWQSIQHMLNKKEDYAQKELCRAPGRVDSRLIMLITCPLPAAADSAAPSLAPVQAACRRGRSSRSGHSTSRTSARACPADGRS